MEKEGALKMPVIAVNDAMTKYLFDNRYGTGQSAWDGINRTTNLPGSRQKCLLLQATAVRARSCNAGCWLRSKCDSYRSRSYKGLEARMDGYRVMKMADAAKLGEIFVTATGNRDILTSPNISNPWPDGAILAKFRPFQCGN